MNLKLPLPPPPACADPALKNYLEQQHDLLLFLLRSQTSATLGAPVQQADGLYVPLATSTTPGVVPTNALAPSDAQYVTLATNATLTAERVRGGKSDRHPQPG